MISFRYHVVSLLAVLLALAAGVALGSGPLQREASDGTGESDAEALAVADTRVEQLEEGQAFDAAYAEATAGELLGDALDGRAVTLVSLPGSADATLTTLSDMVAEAGGEVTARVSFEEKLLDVANRQLVDELATQLHESVERKVDVPAGASGYERVGVLLAHAIASQRAGGRPVNDVSDRVLAGLSTADLVTTQGNIDRRGGLVLLVAGAPYGSADERDGAGSIIATVATALDEGSNGAALVGPVEAAAPDGLVGALRADPTAAREVSTVDVADRVSGAVVTMLALAREATGESGHYGTADAADGPMPGASAD
ncbi:MAG TPA: copper transporter [Marmoricola sp.]|nr:copper transporter [Marmoricola sp.]